MVPPGAVGVDCTFTGIYTFLPPASQGGGAVGVLQTFIRLAMAVGITLVVWQANAIRPVVASFTDCICPTSGEETGILALFPDACLVIATL